MKKLTALVLCLLILCLSFSSALAVTFSWDSSSTTFSKWSKSTSSDGSTWKLTSWTSSNLTATHKAAVKIYSAPGEYASHTFYYQSTSTTAHDYLDGIDDGTTVYAAGKRYSGSGNITVAGTFEP